MPLPTRKPDENRSEFVLRCMGDADAREEFPDSAQRLAVCNSQADRRTTGAAAPQRMPPVGEYL